MPTPSRTHPLRRRCTAAIAAGALTAALTACGEDRPAAGSDDATATPSADADPTEAEKLVDPRTTVRRAVRRWVEADTGTFTQTLHFMGTPTVVQSGSYQLSTRSSQLTMMITPPDEESLELRVRGIQGDTYLNVPTWPHGAGECWMAYSASDFAALTGTAALDGAGGLPGNVLALSYGVGTGPRVPSGDPLPGTVDLTSAVSMALNARLSLALFPDQSVAAPVDVEFDVDDGNVTGWRYEGKNLLAALEREGAVDRLSESEAHQARLAIPQMAVTVEYADVGAAEVDVSPPAPEYLMSVSGERMQPDDVCAAAR